MLTGYAAALLLFAFWWLFTGRFRWGGANMLGLSLGNLAVYLAERKGWLKSVEELDRPLSIFPNGIPDPPPHR